MQREKVEQTRVALEKEHYPGGGGGATPRVLGKPTTLAPPPPLGASN